MGNKNNSSFNPYQYIPFIILVFLLARFFLDPDNLNWFLGSFKSLIFASVIIYLLNPLVKIIQDKFRLNHTTSVLLTYLIVFLVIGLFIMLIVPGISESINSLINNIPNPDKINHIVNRLLVSDLGVIQSAEVNDIISSLQETLLTFSSNLFNYSRQIISSVSGILSNIALLFISFFMAFYALKDSEGMGYKLEKFIRTFFTDSAAEFIIKVAKLTDKSVKKYLLGKLYTCIILGISVSISITIINLVTPLNIPYSPLVGLIIGVTNLIPYIGPFIGTVPCIIFALFSGFWEAIALFIIIMVMQQIDNVLISPRILGNTLGLKPFWIVASVAIGGSLFGAIGMILAIPFASVIQTLVLEKMQT